jgi:hypothetical protein
MTGPESIDLFTCPYRSGGLRLTPAACARSWMQAQHLELDLKPGMACSTCPIGAAHAGRPPAPERPRDCAWCGRSRRRMVLGRVLCISCYNRLRELCRGRNARGACTAINGVFAWRVEVPDAVRGAPSP